MCIICNIGIDQGTAEIACDFLSSFSEAHRQMQKATKLMLECSKTCPDKTQAALYDKTHKAMLRITKQWASVEHKREVKK